MKRVLPVLAVVLLLTGCMQTDGAMNEALALRSAVLGGGEITFDAEITVDYIDTVEEFTLSCSVDAGGVVTFAVTEPETISGIMGNVSGQEGALTFDGQILAFPLMADDRLSPISAPWILMSALRGGNITACVREGELLHITVDDSYAEDALTLEVWAEDGALVAAEIAWQGRRMVSMELENYRCV